MNQFLFNQVLQQSGFYTHCTANSFGTIYSVKQELPTDTPQDPEHTPPPLATENQD